MVQSRSSRLRFLRRKQRLEPLPLRVCMFFSFHTDECTPPVRACTHALVRSTLKTKLHEIIFEADTPAGKAFDIGLMCTILLSVLVVMLESVARIRQHYGPVLWTLEWAFTIAFTLEYLLRLSCVGQPLRYA